MFWLDFGARGRENIANSAVLFLVGAEKHCKLQVVPGRAGGGSFRRKKWCIARKEFAYRMRARRPTSAMRKPFLCCERAFCCSMVVMCRGGDLTCFDAMRSVAGSDEAIWLFVR